MHSSTVTVLLASLCKEKSLLLNSLIIRELCFHFSNHTESMCSVSTWAADPISQSLSHNDPNRIAVNAQQLCLLFSCGCGSQDFSSYRRAECLFHHGWKLSQVCNLQRLHVILCSTLLSSLCIWPEQLQYIYRSKSFSASSLCVCLTENKRLNQSSSAVDIQSRGSILPPVSLILTTLCLYLQ